MVTTGGRGRQIGPWSCGSKSCLSLLVLFVSAFPSLTSGDPSGDAAPQASEPTGVLGTLTGHKAAIYALATSEGLLASGARDRRVSVWDISDPKAETIPSKPMKRLDGHSAGVTSLAFASWGAGRQKVLLSGAADNTTRLWELPSGRQLKVLNHPRTIFGLAGRPEVSTGQSNETEDKGEFATACWDGVVRLFGLPSGTQKATLHGHEGGLYSVVYSPLDGTLLATASADKTVRIWDLKRRKLLWTLRSHKDHVTTVDWSPKEPFVLASGSWDRKFRLWELGTTREVEECRLSLNCTSPLPRVTARHPQLLWRVAFSPTGEQVAACHGAVGQSPTVVIYDAQSGRVVRRLGRHKDTPLALAWSHDSLILASAGMDRKVLLWDAQSTADDMPAGDLDDAEERRKWLQDLADFRRGKLDKNTTDEDRNKTEQASDPGFFLRHPLAGRMAYF